MQNIVDIKWNKVSGDFEKIDREIGNEPQRSHYLIKDIQKIFEVLSIRY